MEEFLATLASIVTITVEAFKNNGLVAIEAFKAIITALEAVL